MSIQVLHGDMLQVLPTLPADSLDSCVCDPPYHLQSIHKRFAAKGRDETSERYAVGAYGRHATGFMGKQWDGGDVAFRAETWAEVLRVLKPGAHLVAFGGTRTFHRMACAIEDAGFEIRDTLCWLYGSGFPKSHDVSKGIDKASGAVRCVVGQNPNARETVMSYKNDGRETLTALSDPSVTAPATLDAARWQGWGTALKPAYEPIILARKPLGEKTVVSNVLRHGTGGLNIDGCRIDLADGEPLNDGLAGDYERMDSGATEGSWGFKRVDRPAGLGRWPANVCHDGSEEVLAGFPDAPGQQRSVGPVNGAKPSIHTFGDFGPRSEFTPRADAGSAARFFYTAKADKGDRLQSKHPTVKPVDLMRWLTRLVTPPGGTILDCFAGSGTTGMAALAEGFSAVLIEREAEYVADIQRRIAHVSGADTALFAEVT